MTSKRVEDWNKISSMEAAKNKKSQAKSFSLA